MLKAPDALATVTKGIASVNGKLDVTRTPQVVVLPCLLR